MNPCRWKPARRTSAVLRIGKPAPPLPNSTRIGELNERSLHRALKALYAAPGSLSEQLIDGYVVDVLIGQRIIEIHTGGFSRLKQKLARLLESHVLTLVHPIAQDRFIIKQGADVRLRHVSLCFLLSLLLP